MNVYQLVLFGLNTQHLLVLLLVSLSFYFAYFPFFFSVFLYFFNYLYLGQLSANFYFDSACTNSYTTIPIFDTDCLADDDDSADDDDDDTGDDDDDYVEAKVISNQYCT